MKPRTQQLLRQRGGEVVRAGRMFYEAVFGAHRQEFFERTGAELEREINERRRPVEMRTCARCGRRAPHARGWTFDGDAWACPSCSNAGR